MPNICKDITNCFDQGYQRLTDHEQQDNIDYNAAQEHLHDIHNKWRTLETETREWTSRTINYFTPYLKNEPTKTEAEIAAKKIEELSQEFTQLKDR